MQTFLLRGGLFANLTLSAYAGGLIPPGANAQMPEYKITFNLERSKLYPAGGQYGYLYLRYYQNWGDGSSAGWQEPVNLPTATLDGMALPLKLSFSYSNDCIQEIDKYCTWYKFGSTVTYDQFAQYVKINFPLNQEKSELVITGTYPQVAYFSATIYTFAKTDDRLIQTSQSEIMDKDMQTLNGAKNPYIPGNPSVFAYAPPLSNSPIINKQATAAVSKSESPSIDQNLLNIDLPQIKSKPQTGQVDFYRINQEMSQVNIDEIAPDGCSQGYLVTYKQQQIDILRMKVPSTFIAGNNPDQTFANYQSRYFSISVTMPRAHAAGKSEIHSSPATLLLPDFWTVNARMLQDYKDKNGYAYVFFAPAEFVSELAAQQHTPATQPPVLTWGNYTGYVLNTSENSDSIILRYRIPDPSFPGNPAHAKCYPTSIGQLPVSQQELGAYTPEMFGDSMENFARGQIGAVNKNTDWPITGPNRK